MTFEELLAQVLAVLQHEGRVSYRALKRRFDLSDDDLADLQDELIAAKQLARDEDGRVLVWTGGSASPLPTTHPAPTQTPAETAHSPVAPPASTLSAPPVPEAERRQLTVLFCDLADSTRLAQQLDPEDLRQVIRAYQGTCAAVIQRFAGHIAQYLGDGLLVYFGYPQAHEDDAQRAVHTGLGIVEALGTLNTDLMRDHGVRLAVRVGIHTGLVVVGEMGSGDRPERLALGETPNLAARLQGLAAPDTVVISATTQQLVQGLFTCQTLGTPPLKGLDQPLAVSQVLGASAARSRFEAAVSTGLTPLVGRAEEVGLLQRRWAQVQEGHGQVVLLSGEAGIGKSRLVQELHDIVVRDGATHLTFRCAPFYQQSALHPVIEHLQRLVQAHREEPSEAQLARLEQALQRSGVPVQETLPLLAALLSLPHPTGYPPVQLSPERQKQKTQEALIAWLVAAAEQQPVLAMWEDLHWADPSTLELLSLLVDQGPTARILALWTFRPDFSPPWTGRSHCTQVTLHRLTRSQVMELIHRVAHHKALPPEVVEQIVAKTDGVPLFVEELTKMVLESGLLQEQEDRYELTGPLPALAIPATLQDSLMARLDRLTTVKAVAQLGATIGRTFAYDLLRAVAALDEATLQQGLRQLVAGELVYQRGVPPQATYTFKHALIQDAAYQSLLKSTRQQYHQRIAQVLEAQFPETAETQPELLAQHYTEAGLREQAIGYWQRAGRRALERSANLEAIEHLTKGLAVLTTLPDTSERSQHELALQTALGPALIAVKGYAAPEVAQAYTRARELCRQVGETPQLFRGLWGLFVFYLLRAEPQTARELGEQLLSLAQHVQDPAFVVEAHFALGNTLLWLGELASSRTHLAQGIALYGLLEQRATAFLLTGYDPGMALLSFMSHVLWYLGYPDQALQKSREAVTLARELSHPYSLAFALSFAARLHQFRRERQATREQAEALRALASEQGFALFLSHAMILLGWGAGHAGARGERIAQIHQGIAAYRATGAELERSHWLALLAEMCGKGGQAEEGLRVLAEALAAVHTTGEHFYEAEIYRLKGEILWQQVAGREGEAEACFHQALDIARCQEAKSLELRAATSLARLWQQQGKRTAAHDLLAPVYHWFTEGFDTADLQEARALLDELA